MTTDLAKHEVTRLLLAWNKGNGAAFAQLAQPAETELGLLARHGLKNERRGHTLPSLQLVNEAYLRLINWENVQRQNWAHFFGLAARIMRRILVNHAHPHRRTKHDGGELHISLMDAGQEPQPFILNVVALNNTLEALAQFAPRRRQIMELRFFGSLTEKEIGQALGISERTVRSEWSLAQAWLFRELQRDR